YSLHLARAAKRRTGTGVGEDVVVLALHIRARIHAVMTAPDAGAGCDTSSAEALQFDARQRAVQLSADLQALHAAGTVTDGHVLFPAIQHEPDWRAGLAREMDCQCAVIADAILRTESAARVVADGANFFFWQIENAGSFVAHTHDVLRGCVE